jgi:hypothetical protein
MPTDSLIKTLQGIGKSRFNPAEIRSRRNKRERREPSGESENREVQGECHAGMTIAQVRVTGAKHVTDTADTDELVARPFIEAH